MSISQSASTTSDTAILTRLIRPEDADLPAEAAKALLDIRFNPNDLARMHELVTTKQERELTRGEQSELENYRRISYMLDLMHSKARRSLKKSPAIH